MKIDTTLKTIPTLLGQLTFSLLLFGCGGGGRSSIPSTVPPVSVKCAVPPSYLGWRCSQEFGTDYNKWVRINNGGIPPITTTVIITDLSGNLHAELVRGILTLNLVNGGNGAETKISLAVHPQGQCASEGLY